MDVVVAVFALFVLPPWCLCCNAGVPKSKAKIIEDYVLSANFDNNVALPYVRPKGKFRGNTYISEKRISRDDADHKFIDGQYYGPETGVIYDNQAGVAHYDGGYLADRDMVPHQPQHPPPPLISPQALYAIGNVAFFTLLGVLQGSLTQLVNKPSLLGGLLGAGSSLVKPKKRKRRRRRSAKRYLSFISQ